MSFVRLASPISVPQAPNQPSAKFIFVAFTPDGSMKYDHLEIGRSMAALMSNLVGVVKKITTSTHVFSGLPKNCLPNG